MRAALTGVGLLLAALGFLLPGCGDSKPPAEATAGAATGGTAASAGAGAGSMAGAAPHAGSASSGGVAVGGSSGAAGGGASSAGTGVCEHELANAACWQSYDIGPLASLQYNYFGGIFDGRYIVFPNATTGSPDTHARLDTQASFTSSGWQGFDTNGSSGFSAGFRGGVCS